jgi:hypothetical protein
MVLGSGLLLMGAAAPQVVGWVAVRLWWFGAICGVAFTIAAILASAF